MRKKKNIFRAVKAFFRAFLLWLASPKELANAIDNAKNTKDLDDRVRAISAGKTLRRLKYDDAIAGAAAMKRYCDHRMKLAENMMLRNGFDISACEECPMRFLCLNEVYSWQKEDVKTGAGNHG